jgi:DNA-binding beta-propeller fold protein YncE
MMHARFARCLGSAVAGIALMSLGLSGAADATDASPQEATTGATAGPVTAYVANLGSRTVIPIRGAAAGTPIFTGHVANAIAITPNGRTVYVVDRYTGTVTPISTATNLGLSPAIGRP